MRSLETETTDLNRRSLFAISISAIVRGIALRLHFVRGCMTSRHLELKMGNIAKNNYIRIICYKQIKKAFVVAYIGSIDHCAKK